MTVLAMSERREGQRTRLIVTGELDLSTVSSFEIRLRALRSTPRAIRLDLSKLRFMDCVGLSAVMRAVQDRSTGLAALDVDPELSPEVKRLVSLLGGPDTEKL